MAEGHRPGDEQAFAVGPAVHQPAHHAAHERGIGRRIAVEVEQAGNAAHGCASAVDARPQQHAAHLLPAQVAHRLTVS